MIKMNLRTFINILIGSSLLLLFQNCGNFTDSNHSSKTDGASTDSPNSPNGNSANNSSTITPSESLYTTNKSISQLRTDKYLHWDLSKDMEMGTIMNNVHLTISLSSFDETGAMPKLTISNPALYAAGKDLQVTGIFIRYNGQILNPTGSYASVNMVVKANTAQYLTAKMFEFEINNYSDDDQFSLAFTVLTPADGSGGDVPVDPGGGDPGSGDPVLGDIELGKTLYARDCVACHAPIEFNNIQSNKYSSAAITAAILQVSQMSIFQGKYTTAEIDAISAALSSQ